MAVQLTFNLIDYVGDVTQATAESMPNINIKLEQDTEIVAHINHSYNGATHTTNTNNKTKVALKFIAQGNKYSVKNIHICKLDTDGSEATACDMPDIKSTTQFKLHDASSSNTNTSKYQLAYGGNTDSDVIEDQNQYFVVQLEKFWDGDDGAEKWDSTQPDGKRNLFQGNTLATNQELFCQHGAVDLYKYDYSSTPPQLDKDQEKYFPYVRATHCVENDNEAGYTYKFVKGVYTPGN